MFFLRLDFFRFFSQQFVKAGNIYTSKSTPKMENSTAFYGRGSQLMSFLRLDFFFLFFSLNNLSRPATSRGPTGNPRDRRSSRKGNHNYGFGATTTRMYVSPSWETGAGSCRCTWATWTARLAGARKATWPSCARPPGTRRPRPARQARATCVVSHRHEEIRLDSWCFITPSQPWRWYQGENGDLVLKKII